MPSILDPNRIPFVFSPDVTFQLWQSEPAPQERVVMVTARDTRVTFFGIWSQATPGEDETMAVSLTRIRDGEEQVIGVATYGASLPNGQVIDFTDSLFDHDATVGDVLVVNRSFSESVSPALTRTMVVLRVGGSWQGP